MIWVSPPHTNRTLKSQIFAAGHGPFSHMFEWVAKEIYPDWEVFYMCTCSHIYS